MILNGILFGLPRGGGQQQQQQQQQRRGSFARESADFGSSVNCEPKVPFVLNDSCEYEEEEEEEEDNNKEDKAALTTKRRASLSSSKTMVLGKRKQPNGKQFACVFDCSSVKGERQYMEDRWNVVRSKCNRVAVFGVYDGHGGCQVSELLAKTLGEKITIDVGRLKRKPKETIAEAFREVDEVAVKENPGKCRRSQASGKLLGSPGAGSTAIVAVVCSWGKVYFANVGDSKATVVRLEEEEEEEERENDENDANVRASGKNKDNKNTPTRASSRRQSLSQSNRSTPVKQRSTTPARKRPELKTTNSDHAKNNSKVIFETPDQRPAREDERTRISNIGGKILKSRDGSARVEGILAVTRAFGNAGIKQFVEAVPEIFEFPIEHCGTVVLCTDGVTDVMNTEDVSSLVAKTIEDDKRARIELQKRRMSLNNNEVATKNGRNSRLGSPHKDLTLRNERTSSETLTSVSIKRRSRDNVTAVVFRCSQNLSSFDYILAETTTTTTTAAHIHSAIVNHVRTVPTSPVLSPIKTDLSKGGVESDELAVHLRESVQAISAANTPSPNKKKKKKANSLSSPNSPLPLPLSSNKKQKKATEPKATKNTKSPLGVLKKEEVRSSMLNA
ncbi:unnamed protein product [Bathycoccus prasinos]